MRVPHPAEDLRDIASFDVLHATRLERPEVLIEEVPLVRPRAVGECPRILVLGEEGLEQSGVPRCDSPFTQSREQRLALPLRFASVSVVAWRFTMCHLSPD